MHCEDVHFRIKRALLRVAKDTGGIYEFNQEQHRQRVVGWKWVCYFELDRHADGSVTFIPIVECEGRIYRGSLEDLGITSQLIKRWTAR